MVSLSIVDDNLVEFNEEFSVLLTTPVNDVIPSQPSTRVLIINNDGVCFYMYIISAVIYYICNFLFSIIISVILIRVPSSLLLISRSGDWVQK